MICSCKILLLVPWILFLAFGCQSQISKKDREKSFRLARQSDTLIRANKLDSAEILIDESLQIYPDNYIAYNNRAYLKIEHHGSRQEIVYDLNKAIEINPEYDIARYSLANYYFRWNDDKNTITSSAGYLSLQLKIQLDSGMLAHIYSITGVSEKHLLQFDNAIIDLEKSIQINPNDEFSHGSLAECYYYGRNDIPSAIAEFTKALNIDSAYYQAYYGREKCERNSVPPLTFQAVSDSSNAEKFDTTNASKPDSLYTVYEKVRKSKDPKISRASAFYDSIKFLFRPAKELKQKVIDNITEDLQALKNNGNEAINTKYLEKIANEAIASDEQLVQKIEKINEVDLAINCKGKMLEHENHYREFLVNEIPELVRIFRQKGDDRFSRAVKSMLPGAILLRQKSNELYDAEEALMDKYALH